MFFYRIDGGNIDHAEVVDIILFHEKEFTKEEFADIYNDAIDKAKIMFTYDYMDNANFIVNILCVNYGFNKVKPTFTVWHRYLCYDKVSTDKMMWDNTAFESR